MDFKIYDSWDLNYKSPFGAIKSGDCCTFSIKLPKNIDLDSSPALIFFKAGIKERFLNMQIVEEAEHYIEYSATLSIQYSGIYYYYFVGTHNDNRLYIKKVSANEGKIAAAGELFQLTVYDKNFETPQFLKGGVMYQIFPDRFYKSGTEHQNIPDDRILHEDWGGTPAYTPDKNNKWNNDYFGGDLNGIALKLPYLKSLGVTCLYLNPIFESHSNHRYNTANYLKIDPLLGTEEDFRNLCTKAMEYNIRIILDGVFSHTGADSIYFNKNKRYETIGAYNSKESEFFPWYTFYEYPDNYEAWWGIDTLPNIQENNEGYTEYICGENGVLRHWLDLGASGYRLDVADELPNEFLENLNKCVKSHNKENVVIGEVWEDASNKESYGIKRTYLLGHQLDSVMNYPFREAIISYVLEGDACKFKNTVMTIIENYPKPVIDVLMNFISTHDIERAINRLSGIDYSDKSKEWQAEYKLSETEYQLAVKRFKCAMALMFFLPGVPCIYYGDEAGLQGFKDPFNRRCYPWDNEDTELIEFTKQLAKYHKKNKCFRNGTIKFLICDEDIIAFARVRKEKCKAIVVFINRSNKVQFVHEVSSMVGKYKTFELLKGDKKDSQLMIAPYDYALIKAEL